MFVRQHCVFALLGCALLTVAASRLQSQANYGSIVGTVTDPTGGTVADAKVTMTDVDTNVSTSTLTNSWETSTSRSFHPAAT